MFHLGLNQFRRHQNVLFSIQRFWIIEMFRSAVIFGTYQNVWFRSDKKASISERLCFRFDIVDITTSGIPLSAIEDLLQKNIAK
jgi:hypothetical protein